MEEINNFMKDKRKHSRSELQSQCFLTAPTGVTCQVLLEDISLSGALLKVSNDDDRYFQVGDLCIIILGDKSAPLAIKRSGKIIRLNSGIIGLHFLS